MLANVALLAISSLCALLIGESLARLRVGAWPFEPPPRDMPYLTEKDANLRWRFSPEDGRNSLGLRNREIGAKGAGVCRILFLGDSLVWSGETSSGELYTQVVEENLNAAAGSGAGVEAINAGVPGYTTYQELEFLKVYGLDMQPDLVILGFVFNDVFYKYLSRPTEANLLDRDPATRLHRFDVHTFPGALLAKSYLAHEAVFAVQAISRELGLVPSYPFESRDDFYLAWKPYGWTETEQVIGEMHQILANRQIPLLVVVFPVSDQMDDQLLARDREYVLYPQSRIEGICAAAGILVLDLTGPLYAAGGKALYRDYLHLNGAGNDQVAAKITQVLADQFSACWSP
jgi:lysophospholipase L1-like esterase